MGLIVAVKLFKVRVPVVSNIIQPTAPPLDVFAVGDKVNIIREPITTWQITTITSDSAALVDANGVQRNAHIHELQKAEI